MDQNYDIVIAGGGLAGLTAAVTAARLGRKTLVLTGDIIGGQLLSIEKIEGFPGFPDGVPGYDLAPMTQEEAANAGAEFAATELMNLAPDTGGWRLTTGEGEVAARAVVLATGSSLRELDVPGEARLRGQGVSHCASCDAPLLRQKVAAVVGGGDSAMQEALTLAAHVAQVVILTHGAALDGQTSFRERVTQHPKITVRPNVEVQEILGDAKVTGVRMRDMSGGAVERPRRRGGVCIHWASTKYRVPRWSDQTRFRGWNSDRRVDAHGADRRLCRRNGTRRISMSGRQFGGRRRRGRNSG